MAEFVDNSEFSLESLSLYDPHDSGEMAQVITGAYAINGRALRHSYDVIDRLYPRKDQHHKLACTVAGFATLWYRVQDRRDD